MLQLMVPWDGEWWRALAWVAPMRSPSDLGSKTFVYMSQGKQKKTVLFFQKHVYRFATGCQVHAFGSMVVSTCAFGRLAHPFADFAEAGNISKPNTTNPATIAFKQENLWRRSSQKTGLVHISNVQSALNRTSPIAKTVEAATTQSNRQEDANLSPTNLSLPRTLSNNMLVHPTQYSPQDTRPFHRGPTTPGTLGPEDHMHSKTSNPMLRPDPLIKHHAINLQYE